MIRLTTCIVILSIVSTLIVADDPCRFEISGKGVIDISSLGKGDGTPAYPDRIPSGGSNYSMYSLFFFLMLMQQLFLYRI